MNMICVTGASGFIARAIVRQLIARGSKVLALSASDPIGTGRVQGDLMKAEWVCNVDFNNAAGLSALFKERRVDTLIHCAWKGVYGSFRNDVTQLDNVRFSQNLGAAFLEAGGKRFIGLGSHAEYGPVNRVSDENTPTFPTVLYGAAKLAAYHGLETLFRNTGREFVWVRVYSTYGPGDDPRWLIPLVITRCLRGEPVKVTTGGRQHWDYLHVEDAARAIVGLTEDASAGVYNLGSGMPVTIRSVVEDIKRLCVSATAIEYEDGPFQPDQITYLCANTSKLRAVGSWQPSIPLAQGLAECVEAIKKSAPH